MRTRPSKRRLCRSRVHDPVSEREQREKNSPPAALCTSGRIAPPRSSTIVSTASPSGASSTGGCLPFIERGGSPLGFLRKMLDTWWLEMRHFLGATVRQAPAGIAATGRQRDPTGSFSAQGQREARTSGGTATTATGGGGLTATTAAGTLAGWPPTPLPSNFSRDDELAETLLRVRQLHPSCAETCTWRRQVSASMLLVRSSPVLCSEHDAVRGRRRSGTMVTPCRANRLCHLGLVFNQETKWEGNSFIPAAGSHGRQSWASPPSQASVRPGQSA